MRGASLFMAGLLAASAAVAQLDEKQVRAIEVTVRQGAIVVPEDGALIRRYHGAIRWELTTPGYRFTDDGIVIHAPEGLHVDCHTAQQGRHYICRRTRHEAQQRYKYDVNLSDAKGRPLAVDPYIYSE